MSESLRLMAVLAHPDDESNGIGGTLAKYAAEGVETHLVCASRGERGWYGAPEDHPGLEVLGKLREVELREAADILGVCEVHFLDLIDGDVDQADPAAAVAGIVEHLRRVRPQVVITWDPWGAYGHPDHIAVGQFTATAVMCAADPGYQPSQAAHRISKLYYLAYSQQLGDLYLQVFPELVMPVDGVDRLPVPWPDWSITTRLDTSDHWEQVVRAIQCHRTQDRGYHVLLAMPDDFQRSLWGNQEFFRVMSTVNGGRKLETDLFEGLRDTDAS